MVSLLQLAGWKCLTQQDKPDYPGQVHAKRAQHPGQSCVYLPPANNPLRYRPGNEQAYPKGKHYLSTINATIGPRHHSTPT